MSYLNVPRLHFAGQFLASPSTINNTASNYITTPKPPYPTYPPDVPPDNNGPVLWNPMGVARFLLNGQNVNGNQMSGCTVQSVMPAKLPKLPKGQQPAINSGLLSASNSKDPLIGASIQTMTDDSPPKIVDLDPDQQLATKLIGIRLQLVLADGTIGFSMKPGQYLAPPNLTDYAGQGVFESQIKPTQIVWNTKTKSALFADFRTACKSGISVKFIMGNYDGNINSPTFTMGQIVGVIGPAKRGEPARAAVGRKYIPQFANSPYNSGYFQIDTKRKKLILDFGNSVTFNYTDGKSPDLSVTVSVKGSPMTIASKLPYTPTNYQLTAGVLEIPLHTADLARLGTNPRQVFSSGMANSKSVLSEYISKSANDFPTGSYVAISQLSLRLGYGKSGFVELIARKFGQPLGGYTLNMGFAQGSPKKGISFPRKVETLKNGKATFQVTTSAPPLEGERADIGSLVYYLKGKWQKTSYIGISFWPSNAAGLSVKAYAEYAIPEVPTWVDDVQPVMVHYMALYPGMKAIHDMSSYKVVKTLGAQLAGVFSIPMDHPAYMPVTRELNPAIQQMVLKWIKLGMPEKKAAKKAMRKAVLE
ncbi:MAG: hypothetical protein AAFP19_23670 [Bacteroidota bacterium]